MPQFLPTLLFLLFLLVPAPALGLNIALVGDSHMEGLAPFLESELVTQGHTVQVVARRGWSCRAYRRAGTYLRRRVGNPDLVVVALGSNDRRTDPRLSERDMTWVLTQMGDAPVVWLGPPVARRRAIDKWHQVASHLQRDLLPFSVTWIDSRTDTEILAHTPDGIHFTVHEYRRWAGRVLEHLSFHL